MVFDFQYLTSKSEKEYVSMCVWAYALHPIFFVLISQLPDRRQLKLFRQAFSNFVFLSFSILPWSSIFVLFYLPPSFTPPDSHQNTGWKLCKVINCLIKPDYSHIFDWDPQQNLYCSRSTSRPTVALLVAVDFLEGLALWCAKPLDCRFWWRSNTTSTVVVEICKRMGQHDELTNLNNWLISVLISIS